MPQHSSFHRAKIERTVLPRNIWTLLLVLLAYTCLRAYHLGYFAFWHDEVFSVTVAQMSWPDMFRAVIADVVHPPFFYILLKLWIAIGGNSAVWLQLLPFLISLLAPIPLLLLFRDVELSDSETLISFWLIGFNELLIHYSQEVRMYSLLVTLSVFSLWLFTRWLSSGGGLPWLTAVNILLAYTHYYGGLFVLTEAIFVIWWHFRYRSRPIIAQFMVASSVVVVSLLPWLYLVIEAAIAKHGVSQNLKFFSRPTLSEVVWFYEGLKGQPPIRHTALLGLALFILPLITCFTRKFDRSLLVQELFLLGFFPTGVSVITSYLLPQSVFSPRFLITVVTPCLILVAIGIVAMKGVSYKVFAVILLSWSAVSGIWFTSSRDRKVPWDGLARQLLMEVAPIYTYELHEHTPLEFYGAKNTMLSQEQMNKDLGDEFYLVYRPNTWPGNDPGTTFRDRGFSVTKRIEVHDMHEQVVALRLQRYAAPALSAPIRGLQPSVHTP